MTLKTKTNIDKQNNTTSLPKYKTTLRKIWRLRKLILVLNLLIIGITFTNLSFKRENLLNFFSVFIKIKFIVEKSLVLSFSMYLSKKNKSTFGKTF
jgi:hypothetical protein